MNFREFFDDDENWEKDMMAQQEQDWKQLQIWTKALSDQTGDNYSVAVQGGVDGYKEPREADTFVLYINQQEITEGDLDQIKQRVQQIAKENGIYL